MPQVRKNKTYVCHICNLSYAGNSGLWYHMKAAHKTPYVHGGKRQRTNRMPGAPGYNHGHDFDGQMPQQTMQHHQQILSNGPQVNGQNNGSSSSINRNNNHQDTLNFYANFEGLDLT